MVVIKCSGPGIGTGVGWRWMPYIMLYTRSNAVGQDGGRHIARQAVAAQAESSGA